MFYRNSPLNLTPRRIARSLSTILLLTLIQVVAAPILAPQLTTPRSEAVSVNYTGSPYGTDLVVPAGVTSITIDARGAAGGTGGNDGNALGISSSRVGYASGTFIVAPGDRVTIYPGNIGGDGVSGLSSAAGGSAGLTAIPTNTNTQTPAMSFNGTVRADVYASGGSGGPAGSGGSSGGGGGGGAASVVIINTEVAIVAGGGGGGGGGSGAGATGWDENYVNTTSALGGNGINGGTCGNADGGGSGGGGGGWFGGAAGAVTRPAGGECRGYTGSAGSNFVSSRATSSSSTLTSANGVGTVNYTLNYGTTSACATTSTVVDIYTVVKVTTTANCTWTVPATVSVVDLFLVGGGGGGAGDGGPGGNGGAAISRSAVPVNPNSTMTIKNGYGGAATSWSYYSTSGAPGDSTTVLTSTGALYYAPGGTASVSGPSSSVAAAPSLPNAGFAGGLGGVGPGGIGAGGSGKTGFSNYFYGTQNVYGGGGGGGIYTSSTCATSYAAPAGVNGGGNGASVVGGLIYPGTIGTDGTGGGGGGGLASGGCGPRIGGGKGGSGVILIRYATNAADSFPSSLTSAVAARWNPSDLQLLDSTRKGWMDSSGTNTSVVNSGFISGAPSITTQGTTDSSNPTGSSKSLLTASGGTADRITLKDLPSNYTLFHVARLVRGGSQGRIFASTSGNWLSGFWGGYDGVTHHNTWLTSSTRAVTQYKWVLSSDRNTVYRADGNDVSLNAEDIGGQSTSTGFGINNSAYEERSTWQVADVIVFNRELSPYENRLMESYIARVYGLTLTEDFTSSETDTAGTFNASNYYYTQKNYSNNLNDTFTVEGWIKASPTCAGVECGFFGRELSLVLRAYQGHIWYALYGGAEWEWTDTGIDIGYDQWHHFAITKRLVGNNSGSMDYYLDGQFVGTKPGNPYRASSAAAASISNSTTVNQQNIRTYLGIRYIDADNYTFLYGALDEFKVWKVARTAAEIAADMNSTDPSNPNLQLYYDFNKSISSSGAIQVQNLAAGGPLRADLIPVATANYADVKVVTQNGPYTTITFPRTYLNQYGGWKVPAALPAATTIIVGGAGGGGYGGSGNAPAGAGGGGGVSVLSPQTYSPGTFVQVRVGQGGAGGWSTDAPTTRTGQSTYLGVASGVTVLGGGGGGNSSSGAGGGGATAATGGGSGGSGYTCVGSGPYTPSGSPVAGATVTSGYNGSFGIWGWGGSGGGARGAALGGDCNASQSGTPGPGYVDPVTNIEYGRGGSSGPFTATNTTTGYITPNNGWGGKISYNGGNSDGRGYSGSAGVVVIRYITAAKPSFTYPTNAYLNAGMTETFTTLVAADSATAMLTRTFRWESTTAGSGGTYSPIKTGTGAANASFSWVPADTATSGSQYLYRVVVTDSDTAGLFIVDTSTSVFAVINGALKMTGVTSIKKTINIAQNETFTISSGTPTYRYTLSPTISGITIDTSTVGSTILRISDTAAVGTFLETLTVTDSVSARVVIPISITISAPPTLVNGGEIITTGQILNIDPGNSASYNIATGAVSDISGTKKAVLVPNGATYSNDYSGVLSFAAGSSQYMSATSFTQYNTWTIETWVRIDAALPSGFCPIANEWIPGNISFALCVDVGRTFFAGFYNGTWTYKRSSNIIPIGSWTHLVGTYDGSAINVYINGVLISVANSDTAAGSTPPQPNSNRIFINKYYQTSVDTPASATYGAIRMYNVGFTQADVLKNYNATKDRFAIANLTQLKPAQKYGALNLESFTVTAGGDTKTVTFAVGNRTGILWDTATAGVVKLSVQESLTPGTYYDTITVTDNFASSTTLPISFTISKADTITVYIDTPTALSYTGSQAAFTPVLRTSGFVSSDAATSTSISYKPAGTSCATGGTCAIGDIGPGGGIVFITPSTSGGNGKYFEAAPQNWLGSDDLASVAKFCTGSSNLDSTNFGATQFGIGFGDTNTALFKAQCTGGAVKLVADYRGGGYSDWFVPATNELTQMVTYRDIIGLINVSAAWGKGNWGYWGSSEYDASTMVTIGNTGGSWGSSSRVSKSDSTHNMVRPVRQFTPCWAVDTCTSLSTITKPIDSGRYVITPSTLVMSIGSLNNYSAVTYLPTSVTINKISQNQQILPTFNPSYPDTLTVYASGGNGNGAVKLLITGGSASGCAFDYRKLSTTSVGSCIIQSVKAADRNYLTDTASAIVFFVNFINNQPSPAAGSGPTIALSGVTSITLDPNVAPTISSLSTYTAIPGTTQITINGSGFDSLNPSLITVKFWRNVVASGFTINGGNSQITVTVPIGATSGKVTVTTPNGLAVSELPLTITP